MIAMMKATIKSLTANVAKLENKCEDLESRSQRNNIRILGVLEELRLRDLIISIFPDYTAKVARARAAFNEVRHKLCGIDGARYGLIHPV
ncbi:hypothetical protein SRHO_G00160180 [Serrasalmus rhombeus]